MNKEECDCTHNDIIKVLFEENKRDKYRYETYRVNKNILSQFSKYYPGYIIDKINTNVDYNADDIYIILERESKKDFKDLFDYLIYRDIFNNYGGYISLLKTVFEKGGVKDYTYLVKDSQLGVVINDEITEIKGEFLDDIIKIFSEIGIIQKDDHGKIINPSFWEIFGFKGKKPSKNIITEKNDINFNEFFPGKSNGRIIRYLKVYKQIPNKNNYDKKTFKEELLATGYVEQRKNDLYYIKEHLPALKEWITDKIIN